MIFRSRRLLPSVIVGALLSGSLALGAGTASADDPATCTAPSGAQYVLSGSLQSLEGLCALGTGVVATLDDLTSFKTLAQYQQDARAAAQAAQEAAEQAARDTTAQAPQSPGRDSATSTTSSPSTPANSAAGQVDATAGDGSAQPAPPSRPAAVPAALSAAVPAQPPVAFSSAPGGLAARIPTLGFGPSLNPALLNVPLSPPLRTLVGQNQASPVTTTSDVQAMAFDGSGGLGTPAIIGVLILAGLGGFALRHRVLRRVRTGNRG